MTLESSSDRLNEMSPVKRALYELREMRARLNLLEQARTEPIAVIGMGCRFPGGANSPAEYWKLLVNGVDAIRETPPERWDVDEFYDPDPEAVGKISTRWGGYLNDIDMFDGQFFGISPREAQALDPQQRLLLEVTWEALENAGQSPDLLAGSAAGAFVGIAISDYLHLLMKSDPEAIDVYLATGGAISVASGRLAYFLGLHGPALSIDTACSSSLVAVHLAVQSLRNGECRMALAGGVNVVLLPEVLINFSRARMVSADGRCKTFDARADGFVRSEGCGMIVLKRLSDAQADRDNILAVIRGTAANQDGRSSGLTAPNGPSQEAVIRSALANAGVQPSQVSYVEAHGTGTSLGDPIEVQALAAVLGEGRAPGNRLQIGSAKTNLGHLETAAGIAGLIKTVLMLQHKEIPPHLHFQEPNPYIPWSTIPVDVATQRAPLGSMDGRYIAGVSSFGFSGTNVHVVLESAAAPLAETQKVERPLHILTLSAKSPAALRELAQKYASLLVEKNTPRFEDICFTADAGRAHLNHRLAVVAESGEQTRNLLAAFTSGEKAGEIFSGQVYETHLPEVAFLFTGHGAQYPGMGRRLYETQPTFKAVLDECSRLMESYLDRSIISVLYDPAHKALMERMAYAQPVLFSIEYALAQLWKSWGISPSIVIGHSLGENVAACVGGAFILEDGLKIVATRGRLMDELPERGEMAAVFADEPEVAEALIPYSEEVTIAAINGPLNTVISGSSQAVQKVLADLKGKRIKSQRLAVAQAAHSPMLDPMLDEYEKVIAEVKFNELQVGLISSVTGKLISSEEIADPIYWRQQVRRPVRFADAMQTLQAQGQTLFLEIGPNPTLLALGRRCLPEQAGVWLPSLRPGWDDWQVMLESLAELYIHGVKVDWEGFDRDYSRRREPLPTYPWQRERYWAPQIEKSQGSKADGSLWKSLIEVGEQQEKQGPLDLQLETYPAKWEQLDRLTSFYIRRTLHEMGVFEQAGETRSAGDLLSNSDILPVYRKLLQRWLQRLESEGYLKSDGEGYTSLRPLVVDPQEAVQIHSHPALSDISILVDYVRRSGNNLAAILRGEVSPLDILFHQGSFETADFIYRKMPLLGYYNGILKSLTRSISRKTPKNRKLRILEVGAGSGGTTSYILPVLPPERTHYRFTDVSGLFLNRAKDSFRQYPFVQYSLLDLDVDPHEQGYEPQSYDLIVAANVLHASQNLSETLDRIRSLLAPGGLLFAFEVTEHLAWFDVTTSLIESLGKFEDGLRTDTPFLTAPQWENAILQAGFERVMAFPSSGSAAQVLGSHIFMAQTPPDGTGNRASGAFQFLRTEEPDLATLVDETSPPGEPEGQDEIISRLAEALPGERGELMIDYVREHLAKVLRISQSEVLDRRRRLMDLGVDSLMAVELKNRLQSGLKLENPLPSTLVYDYPTIAAVGDYLEKLFFDREESAAPVTPRSLRLQSSENGGETDHKLDQLSEEDVEKLLLEKLKDL
jgi:acyl transferase domain-containing protein/SAM-dependent methyltransferase/acyl carrier protein